jgi:hypothetical protein
VKFIDKDVLRAQLPLAYAASELGVPDIDQSGVGTCPFHPDSRPSFRLRRDDDGVERWYCFPCGFGGDVYDLIMRVESCDFPDAITRAEELYDLMPPGWTSSVKYDDSGPAATPEEWQTKVLHARANAQAPENDGLLCVVTGMLPATADDLDRRAADRVMRDFWGWGVDDDGVVLIPHYAEDGRLTAVKKRSLSGFKWGEGGSKYEELYGAWHAQQHRRLLLCEGESDAVWASLQSVGIDIKALPTGAQTFRDRFAEQAKAWDEVYLAFDADRAGIGATRMWIEVLGARARVCRLPRGKDLRDVRPDVRQLLEDAVIPPPVPGGIIATGQRFERVTQQGNRALTSWCANPTARLVAGDADEDVEPAFEVEVDYAGHVQTKVLRASDLHGSGKLKQWAGRHGYDCLASDQDVALLQSLFNAQSAILPEVYQTSRLGIHEPPARYAYAGKTLVLPDSYVGKLPWKFVSKESRRGHVLLDDPGKIDWRWIENARNLNYPRVMDPILAWFAATPRRIDVRNFPLLFVGGASGSGKSTIVELLCRMWGSALKTQLGGTTQFPLMRLLATTTTIPVFIDEWSRQSRDDTRQAFQGAVPFVYAGEVVPRGQRDLTIVELRCTSPVVVAGEDTFALDREQDRMIGVEVARSGQNFTALSAIGAQPLERFGYWYNRWIIETPPDELPPMPDARFATRPEYNLAALRAGWSTLRAFLARAQELDQTVPELPPEPDLTGLDSSGVQRENEYLALMRAALGAHDSSGNELVWESEEGTWVRFKAIASQDTTRRLDVKLPGDSHAMQRYFKGLGHELDGRRISLPFSKRVMYATLIRGFHITDEETA